MTVRFTLKCPKLAQYPAKGISPDDAKTMSSSAINAQTKINNRYNARGLELGKILQSKLNEVDISWCNDGCLVVSCDNTIPQVEQLMRDEGLEIQPDKAEIKHKVRLIDPDDETKGQEEDIDEVFDAAPELGEGKLKSRPVTNLYQASQ